MGVVMACETARICGAGIGNSCSVRGHEVDIKIDESFPGDGCVGAIHSVGSMTSGAREAVIDMTGVLGEARIRDDLVQIVALRAHRVRTVHAEVGTRIEIGDQQPGARSLAEIVAALQNVRPF